MGEDGHRSFVESPLPLSTEDLWVGTSKVTQRVMTPVAKPDNLNFIPRTHMMEKEN